MKICVIAHSSDLSGANLALLETIECLVHDNDLTLFLPSDGPLVGEIQLISHEIDIIVIRYNWWMYRKKNLLQFRVFRNITRNILALINMLTVCRKCKFDIVISNTITISIGGILSILIRKKHYWFFHEFGNLDHGLKFHIGNVLAKNFIKFSNSKIIVNSYVTKRYYDDWLGNSAFLLYYSMSRFTSHIQVEEFDLEKNTQLQQLIIYGRVERSKGHDIVLKALRKAIDSGLNYRLTILGSYDDDKYLDFLKRIISENDLLNYVELKENVSNPIEEILENDIVINCSKSEAFGRTIVEAMFLGKLVIASVNGSGMELLGDNERGILFDRNPDSLHGVFCNLARGKYITSSIRNSAHNYAHEFFNKSFHSKCLNEIFNT